MKNAPLEFTLTVIELNTIERNQNEIKRKLLPYFPAGKYINTIYIYILIVVYEDKMIYIYISKNILKNIMLYVSIFSMI